MLDERAEVGQEKVLSYGKGTDFYILWAMIVFSLINDQFDY